MAARHSCKISSVYSLDVGCRSSDEWQCDVGQCIRNFDRCDGELECRDGSDERGCGIILLCFIQQLVFYNMF